MRAMVTGGAGFIGSALVRRLIGLGQTVMVVDKLTYAGNLASLASVAGSERYGFEHVDICDAGTIVQAIERFRPDVIFHLAAETHVDRSILGAGDFVRTNVLGTHVLLDAALHHWKGLPCEEAKRFRFVHVSTDEVYGALGEGGLFGEDSPYRPSSPYSASKAASDHFVQAWHVTYGLPVVLSNCSNNYGPFQFPEKLIPVTIARALDGKPIPVYGAGRNVRDWLHVDDHVSALLLLAEAGKVGEKYNIGGGNERRNIDVVRSIVRAMDARLGGGPRENLITFVSDRPGHDWRYAIDAGKVQRELGWQPRIGFDQGIVDTVDWYLDHQGWWRTE